MLSSVVSTEYFRSLRRGFDLSFNHEIVCPFFPSSIQLEGNFISKQLFLGILSVFASFMILQVFYLFKYAVLFNTPFIEYCSSLFRRQNACFPNLSLRRNQCGLCMLTLYRRYIPATSRVRFANVIIHLHVQVEHQSLTRALL